MHIFSIPQVYGGLHLNAKVRTRLTRGPIIRGVQTHGLLRLCLNLPHTNNIGNVFFVRSVSRCYKQDGLVGEPIFLDIERAFDKVWTTGVIVKFIKVKIPPP
jgi:hypothetical protein